MSVNIVPSDLARLNAILSEVDQKTDRMAIDILNQASIFAVISASKATEPGTKSDPRKMATKHLFRPIEKIQGIADFWYKKENKGGKDYFFKSPKKISTRKNKHKGLTRLKKGIKFWNKGKKAWDYLPTESTKKWDKSDRRTRIKYAGVAKLGWMKTLPSFRGIIRSSKELNHVTKRMSGTDKSIRIDNLVSYVSNTSPNSANVGMRAAGNRMMKTFKIEEQKLINRLNRR